MLRILFSTLLICSIAVSSLASSSQKSRAPLSIINLISHPGGTLMMGVNAKVNGHEGFFIFDTGGGVSYVSPSFAKSIGCEPWGQISGFMLTGHRLDMPRCDGLSFDLQAVRVKAPIAGVYDLMQFMPANVPRIDGSIGLDVLAGRSITLSLARKQLILESRGSLAARIRRGKEISIRLVRDAEGVALSIVVAVITPKGLAWMEIDSGNGGATVIGKHLAPLFNLKSGTKELQPLKMELAGGIPVEGNARVNDTLIMDGNIGTRFLQNWDLTVDLAKGRAWLAPAESN